MNPKVWGKCMWESMHVTLLNAPNQPNTKRQESIVSFLKALSDVLPCRKCRKSLKVHMKCIPPSKYMKNLVQTLLDTFDTIY